MATALHEELRAGLAASPKRLPCRLFYDEEGSRLFEQICRTPEYYVPAAEDEILEARAGEIIGRVRPATIVELGSGNAAKTRHLIAAVLAGTGELRYVPVDVSGSAVEHSSRQLLRDYPGLSIEPVVGEYREGLALMAAKDWGPTLVLWLGSNVGNFDRNEAAAFLADIATGLGKRDGLLLGIDMRKDPATLEAAYNDADGITAQFNLNILKRLNHDLGADFDIEGFGHRALYRQEEGRIEMHLVARSQQRVEIPGLGISIEVAQGEFIHTESSYKYSAAEIEELAARAGLGLDARWTDTAERFSSVLLRR